MTKRELMSQIDSKINNLFADYSFYDNIRQEAMQDCEKYLQEKGKAMSLTYTIDFLDENVLKHAVSIAMKETINLLAENNLLQVDD